MADFFFNLIFMVQTIVKGSVCLTAVKSAANQMCKLSCKKPAAKHSQSLNKIPLQRCSSIKLHKLFIAFSVKHVQRKPLFMVELGSTFVNSLQKKYIKNKISKNI